MVRVVSVPAAACRWAAVAASKGQPLTRGTVTFARATLAGMMGLTPVGGISGSVSGSMSTEAYIFCSARYRSDILATFFSPRDSVHEAWYGMFRSIHVWRRSRASGGSFTL